MTRSELINRVAERAAGLTKTQTTIILDTFFQSIMDALKNGEKVEIRGFGNFRLKNKKPRKGRNPKTGDNVDVPAKRTIHFKMGKELKELLNSSWKSTSS